MDSIKQPLAKRQIVFEFTLYALIILMTASAGFFNHVVSDDPRLSNLTVWIAIAYFAFLAWAFSRLNTVHRRRKERKARELVLQTRETVADRPGEAAPAFDGAEQSRSVFGLTLAQAAVILLVFTTAVLSFTWALSILR